MPGRAGADGIPGKDGIPGTDGKNGLNGKDGEKLLLRSYCTLTLKNWIISIGREGVMGPQGPQGPPGERGKFQGNKIYFYSTIIAMKSSGKYWLDIRLGLLMGWIN